MNADRREKVIKAIDAFEALQGQEDTPQYKEARARLRDLLFASLPPEGGVVVRKGRFYTTRPWGSTGIPVLSHGMIESLED